MTPFETILVPIDFSDCSMGVVQQAAGIAAKTRARVVLMHALDTPGGLADVDLQAGDGERVTVDEHLRRGAEALMPTYVGAAREVGAEVDVAYAEGRPAAAILSVAERVGADLIVMGTHGRKGLKRLLLGSVAEEVLRRADPPVMTIRSKWHEACQATSCAVCTAHVYDELDSARAELDG